MPDGVVLRDRIPHGTQDAAGFFSGCWFSPGSCVILNKREVLHWAGEADGSFRRLEDYEWFVRIGLAGFRLDVQPLVGACVERGNNTSLAVVAAAAALIRDRISDLTRAHPDRARLLRRADAYLRYERAASAWRERRLAAFAVLMAGSLLAWPRLRLSPTPGWYVRRPDTARVRT
jgi:hypothetical protein